MGWFWCPAESCRWSEELLWKGCSPRLEARGSPAFGPPSSQASGKKRPDLPVGLLEVALGIMGTTFPTGKECDLNRQCGVVNPETKKICTRLLTCKVTPRPL